MIIVTGTVIAQDGRPALAAHFAVPASRAFVKAATALCAEPPTLHVYEATPLRM